MTKKRFIPGTNNILVKVEPVKESGGILMPTEGTKYVEAEVIESGISSPDKPSEVAKYDRVLLPQHVGQQIPDLGPDYYVIDKKYIVLIIREEEDV